MPEEENRHLSLKKAIGFTCILKMTKVYTTHRMSFNFEDRFTLYKFSIFANFTFLKSWMLDTVVLI